MRQWFLSGQTFKDVFTDPEKLLQFVLQGFLKDPFFEIVLNLVFITV